MPPIVIDIRSAEDTRDVVHRAVQVLAEGGLLAVPTETVYGLAASGRCAAAVERLLAVKQRPTSQPLTLAVKSADAAMDYAPDIGPMGRRLSRRCWPGPITLVAPCNHPASLVRQLPDATRDAVAPNGTVGLRVPAHQTVLDILRMLTGPIVLTSANRRGMPDCTTAESVVDAVGGDVDLILDDGVSRLGQPSTVVQVAGNHFDILRVGVVPETTLRRLANLIVLLVCTGNTCRSPMAEIMCRKMLADQLGCKLDELADQGVLVMSAGISAALGARPSPEAVTVMAGRKLDLNDHESQPLTQQLVRHADVIWTMTQAHRGAIVGQWPEAAARASVLCRDGSDVTDPIGGPVGFYQQCALQMEAELKARLKDLGVGP